MNYYSKHLEQLRGQMNLRRIPEPGSSDGNDVLDLSGNDYLGISSRADLQQEFFESLHDDMPAMSAVASRLLASDQSEFAKLEALVSEMYGAPALLFNSGYHANSGSIAALAAGKTLIVADRLVHASIIDGMILSRAAFERFHHNDTAHLERILAAKASAFDRVLIVVESVYSMDGDIAPIDEITAVKRTFPNAELYVDEAHAFGILGRDGLGLTAYNPEVDFTLCTLGKAAASEGAFLVCRADSSRDYLVNTARSLIFSTAIAPLNCAWSRFVIGRIPSMSPQRLRLRQLAETLGAILGIKHPTHIQPFVTGSSESALALSARLLENGFKVLPIRTPTVPPGTERLRFSLSASMTPERLLPLKQLLENKPCN